MKIGGNARFAFRSLQMVSAVHSKINARWAACGSAYRFVIRTPGEAFYHSGDTALTLDMAVIPKKDLLDFAVQPPRANFPVAPEGALEAACLIGCNEISGVHINTSTRVRRLRSIRRPH
jgi:L-ascorbate metabolism protein UlaG (beta-lactamase superfamily)